MHVTLDLPVQPFQLAVGLQMPYPCKYIAYVQLQNRLSNSDMSFFFASDSGIELGAAISQYGCRLSMILYGLLQYYKGVFHSGMIKDAVSGNKA